MPDLLRRAGELHGKANVGHAALDRVRHLHTHLAMQGVFTFERLRVGVHTPGRQPGRQPDRQSGASDLLIERAITEADYGQWQGRKLADLAKEPLWRTVQANPSAVVFPGGESMQTMQSRAVAAVRRIDAEVEAEHGPGAVWVAVSHGDIIKSVLADAFGMHLDLFQRIGVGPASVSVVRYGEHRPEVVATNTESGDLSWLRTAPAPSGDAAVGGGSGHPEPDAHTGTGRPAPDAPGGPARP